MEEAMRGSPLVYELEDPDEFSLDPLTDSTRPGVQTALQGWMVPRPESGDDPREEPEGPPPPTLGEWLEQHGMALLFVTVMSLSWGVRLMSEL